MVMRGKLGPSIGTKHTFTASAATKAFAIAKLAFANAFQAMKAQAAVARPVHKTAMAMEFAARFSKVVTRIQKVTPRGMGRKHNCVYVMLDGPDRLAVCVAVLKEQTL
jgi:hypothetical protein